VNHRSVISDDGIDTGVLSAGWFDGARRIRAIFSNFNFKCSGNGLFNTVRQSWKIINKTSMRQQYSKLSTGRQRSQSLADGGSLDTRHATWYMTRRTTVRTVSSKRQSISVSKMFQKYECRGLTMAFLFMYSFVTSWLVVAFDAIESACAETNLDST